MRGARYFSPAFYSDLFAHLGVSLVIRAASCDYDASPFDARGIEVEDLLDHPAAVADDDDPRDEVPSSDTCAAAAGLLRAADRLCTLAGATDGLIAVHGHANHSGVAATLGAASAALARMAATEKCSPRGGPPCRPPPRPRVVPDRPGRPSGDVVPCGTECFSESAPAAAFSGFRRGCRQEGRIASPSHAEFRLSKPSKLFPGWRGCAQVGLTASPGHAASRRLDDGAASPWARLRATSEPFAAWVLPFGQVVPSTGFVPRWRSGAQAPGGRPRGPQPRRMRGIASLPGQGWQ